MLFTLFAIFGGIALLACVIYSVCLGVNYLKKRLATGKKATFSTKGAAARAIQELEKDAANLSAQDLEDISDIKETLNKSEQVAFEYESNGIEFKGFDKELDNSGVKQKFREGNGVITVNA